jgi:hypothetical protein
MDALTSKLDRSIGNLSDLDLKKPGNRLEGSTFTCPVCSQKGYDSPFRDFQGNSLEDEDHFMVFNLNII